MQVSGTQGMSQWSRIRVPVHERICVYFCVGVYTFSSHADRQTLLEAAGGTTFPLGKVHGTPLLFCTGVVLVILH